MSRTRLLSVATFMVLAVSATALQGQNPPPAGTVSAPTFSNITKSTFDFTGTYTTATGWTAAEATYSAVPKNGGTTKGGQISFDKGKLGTYTIQGNIVPYTVTGCNYGTEYNVTLFVKYTQGQKYQPGYKEEQVGGVLGVVKTLGP